MDKPYKRTEGTHDRRMDEFLRYGGDHRSDVPICVRDSASYRGTETGKKEEESEVSKKTRSQRQREREQAVFIGAVSLWIVAMVGVILYKAVRG